MSGDVCASVLAVHACVRADLSAVTTRDGGGRRGQIGHVFLTIVSGREHVRKDIVARLPAKQFTPKAHRDRTDRSRCYLLIRNGTVGHRLRLRRRQRSPPEAVTRQGRATPSQVVIT